jgi:hypothetical protein
MQAGRPPVARAHTICFRTRKIICPHEKIGGINTKIIAIDTYYYNFKIVTSRGNK